MKVGISGDWHIDNMGGTYLVDGTPNRELDLDKQILFMAETCKNKNVECFILNGDLGKATTMNGHYLSKAVDYIREFISRKMKVYVLPGNHDLNEKGEGIINILNKFKNEPLLYVKTIECLDGIMMLPHERKEVFKEYKDYTDYVIKNIKGKKFSSIVGHFQPTNAIPGSEQDMFSGSTRFLDTAKIKDVPIIYNHVHKPQQQDNVYSVGSPVKFNIGERDEEKRFIIFDTETGEVESVPLDCQKIFKISVDLVNKNSVSFSASKFKKYKDSMVSVYIEAKKENRCLVSKREISEMLEEAGAHLVVYKIKTTQEDTKRTNDSDNNQMLPPDVFKRVVNENTKKEDTKRITQLGLSVLSQVGGAE